MAFGNFTYRDRLKKWSLGCVIPASWLPLAAGARSTQPRDHSLAHPCTLVNAVFLTRGHDGGDVVGGLNLHLKVLGQVVSDGERHAHRQEVLLPLECKVDRRFELNRALTSFIIKST